MKKLNIDDLIEISDLEFRVTKSDSERGYYLNCRSNCNEFIFEKLEVDKFELQKRVLGYSDGYGAFPYCKTMEDLEVFVEALERVSGVVPDEPLAKTLRKGERINLCGIDATVSRVLGYYLQVDSGSNKAFFNKINVPKTDLQKRVLGYSEGGDFPECKTLEDLTKFVSAIEEEYLQSNFGVKAEAVKMRTDKPISDFALKCFEEFTAAKTPDYTIDLSPEKIKKDSKINNFILLNL